MPDGIALAAGHLLPLQNFLHNHKVPSDHACVMITSAKECVKAPLVLGDPDENSVLQKNQVFALPKRLLYKPSLGKNNSVNLLPYIK